MKLEVGKKYVLRNGEVVGPLEDDGENVTYRFLDPSRDRMDTDSNRWLPDGVFLMRDEESPLDIVSEYTEPAPPLQWKWMKPDRCGVWAFGGPIRTAPPCQHITKLSIIRHECFNESEGWYCWISDVPKIVDPEKQKVKKRLYVRRERAPLDCSPAEIKHFWVTEDTPSDVPERTGWKSTDLIEEFEE